MGLVWVLHGQNGWADIKVYKWIGVEGCTGE